MGIPAVCVEAAKAPVEIECGCGVLSEGIVAEERASQWRLFVV